MLFAKHPHDVSLPCFKDTSSTHVEHHNSATNPRDIASQWLSRFAAVLASNDASKLTTVFHDDSWWRDAVALDWDLHTFHGLANIIAFLSPRLATLELTSFKLAADGKPFAPSTATPIEGLDWVQSMFFFETAVGRGRGILRLAQAKDGVYKAHLLYTALDELKGFEENVESRRPLGGKNSLEGGMIKGNWFERRQRQKEFLDEEPQVLLIGAGEISPPLDLSVYCILNTIKARLVSTLPLVYRL